jgi:glycolate oxidase FAD binding subunit
VPAPHGIVSYAPAEMTVTVRAGTPVAELDAVLAECRQRSALPDRGGTVGGAVAVGENHVGRRARGTVSASILQLRYVSAEGKLVTGGGPTVKNVTGFDLPRLMVGSLGTLGLVAEVIVRTNPVPEVSCWLQSSEANPFEVDRALLRPAAVLWNGTTTWVNLEGHRQDVDAERAVLAPLGPFDEVEGPPPLPEHRWSLPPDELRCGLSSGAFVASIGVGAAWASAPQPQRALAPAVAAIGQRLKQTFDPRGRLNPGRSLTGTGPWT